MRGAHPGVRGGAGRLWTRSNSSRLPRPSTRLNHGEPHPYPVRTGRGDPRRRRYRDSFSVLSDFKVLRGGKFPFPNCSFVILTVRQPASRTVSRAPVYHILWVRGFWVSGAIPFPGADSIFSSRCGAISGRLRFLPSGHPRAAIPAKETPQPGEIAEGLRRGEAGGAAACLAARRNASDGFGGGRFPKSEVVEGLAMVIFP
jgi:hypothetical protein